jgi:hypothetical protein
MPDSLTTAADPPPRTNDRQLESLRQYESASRAGRSRPACEHDQSLRADDLGAAASSAAHAIDHSLEVIDVCDAHPDQSIRVASECERLDQLGQISDRRVNLVDLGAGGEAKLREGLDPSPEHAVVEDRRVPTYVASLFEPVDAALRRGRRKADQAPDVAGRAPPILDEKLEDAFVD